MMVVAIVMVEGEAVGVDEATFCEAVTAGLESVRTITYMMGHYPLPPPPMCIC